MPNVYYPAINLLSIYLYSVSDMTLINKVNLFFSIYKSNMSSSLSSRTLCQYSVIPWPDFHAAFRHSMVYGLYSNSHFVSYISSIFIFSCPRENQISERSFMYVFAISILLFRSLVQQQLSSAIMQYKL